MNSNFISNLYQLQTTVNYLVLRHKRIDCRNKYSCNAYLLYLATESVKHLMEIFLTCTDKVNSLRIDKLKIMIFPPPRRVNVQCTNFQYRVYNHRHQFLYVERLFF